MEASPARGTSSPAVRLDWEWPHWGFCAIRQWGPSDRTRQLMCPREEGGALGVVTQAALSTNKKALSGRGLEVPSARCWETRRGGWEPLHTAPVPSQLNLHPAP